MKIPRLSKIIVTVAVTALLVSLTACAQNRLTPEQQEMARQLQKNWEVEPKDIYWHRRDNPYNLPSHRLTAYAQGQSVSQGNMITEDVICVFTFPEQISNFQVEKIRIKTFGPVDSFADMEAATVIIKDYTVEFELTPQARERLNAAVRTQENSSYTFKLRVKRPMTEYEKSFLEQPKEISKYLLDVALKREDGTLEIVLDDPRLHLFYHRELRVEGYGNPVYFVIDRWYDPLTGQRSRQTATFVSPSYADK